MHAALAAGEFDTAVVPDPDTQSKSVSRYRMRRRSVSYTATSVRQSVGWVGQQFRIDGRSWLRGWSRDQHPLRGKRCAQKCEGACTPAAPAKGRGRHQGPPWLPFDERCVACGLPAPLNVPESARGSALPGSKECAETLGAWRAKRQFLDT
jgi:hypothetical protein